MNAEVLHYVPEPVLFLVGCRPLVPHARGPCPVCYGLIGRLPGDSLANLTGCGYCDALSPRNEARVLAQRLGLKAVDRNEAAERAAVAQLRGRLRQTPRLTESERRRLWNGYKGGILKESGELTNRAKVGREFLRRIDQLPDWDLILDGRGRIIGRHSDVQGRDAAAGSCTP